MTYFIVSIIVLAALLFIPVNKLIWVVSVRRMQRKVQRELTTEEIQGQAVRARFIALFVCILFSFLFNANLLGIPGRG